MLHSVIAVNKNYDVNLQNLFSVITKKKKKKIANIVLSLTLLVIPYAATLSL